MTGMSSTGKSTALRELRRRGFDVLDTDEPGWTEWRDEDGGYVWREERITELLAGDRMGTLYVSGTVSNEDRLAEPTAGLTSRCTSSHPSTGDEDETPFEVRISLESQTDEPDAVFDFAQQLIDAAAPFERRGR